MASPARCCGSSERSGSTRRKDNYGVPAGCSSPSRDGKNVAFLPCGILKARHKSSHLITEIMQTSLLTVFFFFWLISAFSDLKGATEFIHADSLKVHVDMKNECIGRENTSNLLF